MEVLDVTERTAAEAAALQESLLERGVPADHPDALIAASAREHGATFATAERHFWREEVREVLSVPSTVPEGAEGATGVAGAGGVVPFNVRGRPG